MKYNALMHYALVAILALALSACQSGSASGTVARVGIPGASISVAITSPTSAAYLETPDETVTLAGTAASDSAIVSVSWVSDRGWQGEASGTESWQTGSIPLELGDNAITVVAEDSSGASASRTIDIRRESGGTGSVTLSWAPPTTRTDGSPLTNLAGFKIYYGRMSGIYDYQTTIRNPGILTYVVDGLVPGDWYFALAAYDSQGLLSDRSNEVLRTIS